MLTLRGKGWGELDYWKCGEWQVVREKLKDDERNGYVICPGKEDLFQALKEVPFERVRVLILGQDPYPRRHLSTGVAFSIPATEETFPASLVNMFTELVDDIGCSLPTCGSLLPWCKQGVLLWNAYPSCREGQPGSHHWDEWTYLTKEIVEKLDERHIVFCLLGNSARAYARYINRSPCIATTHPSPLSAKRGFLGSRVYSNINLELENLGKDPITWQDLCGSTSTVSTAKATE